MNVYIDESGDLGWKFDAPYMRGGSSRYLTIAMLIAPKTISAKPKRLVKKLYKYLGRPHEDELKATHLSDASREWFAEKAADLLDKEPSLKLVSITVRKENVQEHIRTDSNKIYNYMIRLALVDHIAHCPHVNFIPDKRTVKVESGNSLSDYLQTHLWFEKNVQTIINNDPQESHNNLNLQFIDYIANIIWRRYELNKSGPYNRIRNHVRNHQLFF